MGGLMFEGVAVMKYECFTCGDWVKKSERQNHEKDLDHDVSTKGKLIKPVEVMTKPAEPVLEVKTARIKAPKDSIKEIPKPTFKVEESIESYTRRMYPHTYTLLDTIRGSMLNPQR